MPQLSLFETEPLKLGDRVTVPDKRSGIIIQICRDPDGECVLEDLQGIPGYYNMRMHFQSRVWLARSPGELFPEPARDPSTVIYHVSSGQFHGWYYAEDLERNDHE